MYLQLGKRALVIVANYEQTASEITVTLDRKVLGFGADAALEAKDAVTGEAISVENDTLRLKAGAELWRMVRVASKGGL